MNVICVSKDQVFKDLIHYSLIHLFDVTMVHFDDLERAFEILEISGTKNLILIDGSEELNIPRMDFEALDRLTLGFCLIYKKNRKGLNLVEFELQDTDAIIDYVSKISGLTPKQSRFITFPLNLFTVFKVAPFDLYLSIGKEKVKLLNASEEIDYSRLDALKSKGLIELSIEEKFRKEFSSMLIHNLISAVENSRPTIGEDSTQAKAFEIVREIVFSVGIKPKLIPVCEAMITSTEREILSSLTSDHKKKILYFKNSKQGFHYQYVIATSHLCGVLLKSLNHEADFNLYLKELITAAYFSDMTLTKPSFVLIRDDHHLVSTNISDRILLVNHARDAAKIFADSRLNLPRAETIIRQHHLSELGVGYISHNSHVIDRMSFIFNVAQEAASRLLTSAGDKDYVIQDWLKHEKSLQRRELIMNILNFSA